MEKRAVDALIRFHPSHTHSGLAEQETNDTKSGIGLQNHGLGNCRFTMQSSPDLQETESPCELRPMNCPDAKRNRLTENATIRHASKTVA
jgi:hypothetical protein